MNQIEYLTSEKIAKLPEMFAQIDKLVANHYESIKTLGELKRSIIHECGKHLDEPVAREFYLNAKIAELTAMGVKLSIDGRRMYKADNGHPYHYNPDANALHREIQRVRALNEG